FAYGKAEPAGVDVGEKRVFTHDIDNPQRTISGHVTDESGAPVEGATIGVKGTIIATTTDAEGAYSIILPEEYDVLVFSSVGFIPEERPIGSSSVIDVELKAQVGDLDEVVVVGFGTQKKASIVGAISTIEPNKLTIGSSRAMSNVLSGQLAGVIGTQRQGAPGSD